MHEYLQAKGSIMQTAAYAEIKQGLPASATLNAADFLGKTQSIVDEVMKKQRETGTKPFCAQFCR